MKMLFSVKEIVSEDFGVELLTSRPAFQEDDLLIVKYGDKKASAAVGKVRKDSVDHIRLNKWQRDALGVKLDENVEVIRFSWDDCPPAAEITLGISSKLLGVWETEKLRKCIHRGLLNKPLIIGESKRIPFLLDENSPETDVEVIDTIPTDALVTVTLATTCKVELFPITFVVKRIKELVLGLEKDIPWEKKEEIFAELEELTTQYDAITGEYRKLKALKNPPLRHGIVISKSTVDTKHFTIGVGGHRYDVEAADGIDPGELKEGREVLLNEKNNIINIYGIDKKGESAEVINLLDLQKDNEDKDKDNDKEIDNGEGKDKNEDKGNDKDNNSDNDQEEPQTENNKKKPKAKRLQVRMGGTDFVVETGEILFEEGVAIGDMVRIDPQLKIAYEKLPAHETGLELEEVPDISYNDIGGLDVEIGLISDAIELPYLYAEIYKRFKLERPKGILLYGPPGCGKTMIAKAIANGLTLKIKEYLEQKAEKTVSEKDIKSYFMNVKGPELLDKYVGETEYKIRKIFEKAKLRATFYTPVVLFFDEMEAMFRKRGAGKSSDVETTIVPQFLSMMDGVEEFSHIIIIGATNRPDMLDPAVKRPGRLDIKIKIDRPDRTQAKDIFKKFLLSSDGKKNAIPLAMKEPGGKTAIEVIDNMIEKALEIIFDTNNFLEVSSSKGSVETFPLKNFISGAIIKSIISRASQYAVKGVINKKRLHEGITAADVGKAVKDEFEQNRDHLVENIPEMAGQEVEINIHIGKDKAIDKWDIPKERPYPGARRQ